MNPDHQMKEAESFPEGWTPNSRTYLVLLTRRGYVLLLQKTTGLAVGKIIIPGGKLDPGETAFDAVRREMRAQLQIEVAELEKMGELRFEFVDGLKLHCVVFHGTEFTGTPTASHEEKPKWFYFSEVPYNHMSADDRYWLPHMLEGGKFTGWFHFDGESLLSHKIEFETTFHDVVSDVLQKLRPFRILMTLLLCISTIGVYFLIYMGSIFDRLSPTYSGGIGTKELVYAIGTMISMIAAIWVSSRKLLVLATMLIAPLLFGATLIAFVIPEVSLTLLLPILWLSFCLIAWPAYKKIETSKARGSLNIPARF